VTLARLRFTRVEQPRFKRVTAHDVARRAGVSQPTVSLVLSRNANARVAPETRERVLEAARELGYVPNVVARSLVQSRSYAIGVIVPDLRNPFFAEVISGAERVVSEAGFAVLLCETREIPRDRHIQALLERQVDGIMMDAIGASSLPQEMVAGVNLVLIDEPADRWPGVASDALGAGKLAAEHLLALGHTRLGLIGPATNVHAMRMRERGFAQALAAHGIAIDSAMLRRVPATAAGGAAGMHSLLALDRAPTAVFCINDLVAAGALKVCSHDGVRVPEDISLVGCEDIELATLLTPELTTIAIPARELGARAARILLQALQEGGNEHRTPPRSRRTIASRLVVRGTTAPPPASREK
jgi:DNA-binding LacI/PurR family transcriptional regulator